MGCTAAQGRPWREAWEHALYGPDGFFLQSAPADHFRTSVAVPLFARAVRRLAGLVDDTLDHPDPFDVVDVGAGRGELLLALGQVPDRWRLIAVERAPDPVAGLEWSPTVPPMTGLLMANEWLDNVPCEVLQDGRLVHVTPTGQESLGNAATPETRAWVQKWWPSGGRLEVGAARDEAWASAVGQVQRGLAVAIDYGHLLAGHLTDSHLPGGQPQSSRRPTLTGYRSGRQVSPVPDGSCDLTAHVALDACAAATGARLLRQREALQALEIGTDLPTWTGDSTAYARDLERTSQARTLLDPDGLGGFGWLVQAVGCADPLAQVSATIRR